MTARRPTPDEIVSRMNPGQVYEASTIAGKFGVNVSQIKPILEALVESGQLRHGIKRHSGRQYPGYVRMTETEIELRASTSIAGPAYARDWRSTLTGYDREIRDRTALCMMARAR
ncbi:hypothetical protein [Burkholderia cenocepacia]|uniref:hypothetical protein n=1 Tax=Burkholderia cenocepacia TaxID=95486 RepID=UPI002238283F|nr:hypothetical protein [Burkholderia cenocepacia]MCW5141096.1 hypothetical protein [Burkholderia cenocepacia]